MKIERMPGRVRAAAAAGLAAAAAALVAAGPVWADGTVTFEAAAPSSVSYTEAGVTFTSQGAGGIDSFIGPNGTKGILSTSDFSNYFEIRGTIAGGASFVSVDLGDFNQDPDLIFLEVFDAGDNSLGITSQLVASSYTGMNTLSLSASNISYAVFGARAPALGGSTAYADNFTYRSPVAVAAVPEPGAYATGALFAGTLGLGLVRGRRRKGGAASAS